jgi:DNA repair protein RadC
MSKLKKGTLKKNNDLRYPAADIVNESGNKIRPDYHPGYQGYRCRVCLVRENTANEPIPVTDQKDAYNLVKEEMINSDREMMLSILLTAQNTLIGVETVCIGSTQICAFTPAEVFKGALLANAVSIILCHNHPSGNLNPSADDLRITESMEQVGKLIGIKVLDHLIVSHEGFRSIMHK